MWGGSVPPTISAWDCRASAEPLIRNTVCRLSYLNVLEAADDIGVCDIKVATGWIEDPSP